MNESSRDTSPAKPLRVLLLFDSSFPYYGGGRETGIYHVAKYGREQGLLELDVITLAPPASTKSKQFPDAEDYCTVHPVFSWRGAMQMRGYNFFALFADQMTFPGRAARMGRALCRQKKFDAILCVTAGPLAPRAIQLAREFNCISVLNMRAFYAEEIQRTQGFLYRPFWGRLRRVEREAIRGVDLVLANGEDTYENCRDVHGRTGPIELVHNGVDTGIFTPGTNPELRSKLGWDGRVVFMSNNPIREIKGPQDAIAALARLPESIRGKVQLAFLGQGSFDPYQELAESLGVGSQVSYLGCVRHHELPDYLRAADVALHPVLFSAGTTHASLETLSCGLPQLSYNGASLRSTCINDQTGILVPLGDVDGLSAGMARLAEDETLRTKLGEGARAKAAEFDWNCYVRRYVEAIAKVCR